MTLQYMDENREAVNDYQAQAHDFLMKSRGYLAANDLHQASENGWDAATHIAKAVAAIYGWDYRQHRDFSAVLNNAYLLAGNDRLLDLRSQFCNICGVVYRAQVAVC